MLTFRDRVRKVRLFFYNPNRKTIMTRTLKSWKHIICYYFCLWSSIAIFAAFLSFCWLYPIYHDISPALTGEQNLLRLNPGLSIIPPVDYDSPTMRVTTFDSKYKRKYVNYMSEYLSNYTFQPSNCDFITGQRLNGTIHDSCRFPLQILGPCWFPEKYLFDNDNACYYLKLNKIYGYVPDIKGNKITVECKAKFPKESDLLGQPVYYPSVKSDKTLGYFSSVPFPYICQSDYQTPLLAVTFPNIQRNKAIMVSCMATNLASATAYHFEVSVDTEKTPIKA